MVELSSVTSCAAKHTLTVSHSLSGCRRPERFFFLFQGKIPVTDHMNRFREGEFEQFMTLLRLDKVALIELRMMPTLKDMTSGWWFQGFFVYHS